jgi:hypothetical protein
MGRLWFLGQKHALSPWSNKVLHPVDNRQNKERYLAGGPFFTGMSMKVVQWFWEP